MKSILQINTVGNSGSTGRIVEEIGQEAIQNGWESYIAYGRNGRESQSHLIKIESSLGIKYHGLQTRLFDRHGLASTTATRKLILNIIKIKPDIIHLHNLHGYYINIKILFKYLKESNIPVIWTLHDCWSFTGHCVHFSFVKCNKWKMGCYSCPQLDSYPRSFFIDGSKRNYRLKKELFTGVERLTVVTVSNWLGKITGESFLSKFPIKVINNGIDLNIFKPVNDVNLRQKFNIESKFVILGVASDWIPRKGINDFLELNKYLNSDYKIILVGLTKSQIKKIPQNILGLVGTDSKEELARLYSAADLFLNLSVEETFGLTTVEALACGTPAIVYDSTACPEVISEQTGITVIEGDIHGLLAGIQEIRSNGKSYYSLNCVEHAKKLYNKRERYLEYIRLYEESLNEI